MANNRPKGFIDWTPNETWAPVIAAVQDVLEEYHEELPLTVRQIFYRLTETIGYQKTEKAYNNLANAIVKARRARIIDFRHIRDDGGTTAGGPWGDESVDEFLRGLEEEADNYYRNINAGQPFHIEVFCEAEGMVRSLGRATRDYGVRVTGTGGFASLTVNYELAVAAARRKVPTIFLHLGDYDPSGVSIFTSMSQDIGKMVVQIRGGDWNPGTGETFLSPDDDGPDFRPKRIGLTPELIERYNLQSAPPKASDSRSANWEGETVQLEAMSPTQIRELLTESVEEWIDFDLRSKLIDQNAREREVIGDRVVKAVREARVAIDDAIGGDE
jgi:hypothetical protein